MVLTAWLVRFVQFVRSLDDYDAATRGIVRIIQHLACPQ